jgi:hypothetical protein
MSLGDRAGRHGVAEGSFTDALAGAAVARAQTLGSPALSPASLGSPTGPLMAGGSPHGSTAQAGVASGAATGSRSPRASPGGGLLLGPPDSQRAQAASSD